MNDQASASVNRLAVLLQNRILELVRKDPVVELGEIQGDLSLKVDSLPGLSAIPATDYLVCGSAALDYPELAPPVKKLRAGDRVLVVWAGDEAIVVERLFVASEVL